MQKLPICLLVVSACAFAQENPLTTSFKNEYGLTKGLLTRSADKVSEADYEFRPTKDVRSFGQVLGHVADAQYLFCSAAIGEKSPAAGSAEKTKTTKADLVAALKEAFAYCDKAYDAMTDATAAQAIKFFGQDTTKLGVLAFNNMHNMEHYGNLVTYMRLKNIVPPSSEPRPRPAAQDKKQ